MNEETAVKAPKSAPETNPIVKFRKKPTRGGAIKAFCCQCMGCDDDSLEPGFRADIRDCPAIKCALHQYRPFQRKEGPLTDCDMDEDESL